MTLLQLLLCTQICNFFDKLEIEKQLNENYVLIFKMFPIDCLHHGLNRLLWSTVHCNATLNRMLSIYGMLIKVSHNLLLLNHGLNGTIHPSLSLLPSGNFIWL